jgi:hypothetical protein
MVMRAVLLLLVLSEAFLGRVEGAALLPQDSYLPLKDGALLTYVVEDVGVEASAPAREVTAEVGEGADWTPVTNYLGYRACWLRESVEGIELKLDAKPDAPALTILKRSAKTGETWTGTLGKETLTFTLRGEETVERGETKVQAMHVEFTAAAQKHAGHTPTHGDVWFAAGLGIVRAQVTTDLDCHTATAKVYRLK